MNRTQVFQVLQPDKLLTEVIFQGIIALGGEAEPVQLCGAQIEIQKAPALLGKRLSGVCGGCNQRKAAMCLQG